MAQAAKGVSYESIVRDVRAGNISPVYYLMGEEDYYIDKLSDFLVDALLSVEDRDFNLDVLYGAETTADAVVELARAYPMMADRRVVLVREAQSIRSLDALTMYLSHITPSSVLIFCHKHGVLDKRKAVYKALQQSAVIFESKRLYESQLPTFVANYLKERKVSAEPQAVQMLAGHVGADLCRLAAEMDKLLLALPQGQGVVTAALVEEQTGMSREFNDFELLAALACKNVLRANQIVKYYQGNLRSFALPRTLSTLFSFFSDVMIAFYSPEKTESGVAAWLGKPEWKVRQDIWPACKNYGGMKVMRILTEIRKIDAASKGVGGAKTPHEELLQDLIFFILH